MTALSALLRGQAMAEEQMIDAGQLREPDTRVLNQTTGQYTDTVGALVYEGKAKLQTTDTIGHSATANDRVVVSTRFELHLPVSAPQAEVGQVWTTTVSVDPQLVGKRFRVASLVEKTYLTARRLAVEEIQS